jgi:flagellar biosynthetic protein FliR
MIDEDVLLSRVVQFAYIFLRVTSIFVLSPVLGKKNAPNEVKVMLCLILSYVFVNMFPPEAAGQKTTLSEFASGCLKELLIGLSIGFVTILFFSVILSAGHITDTQIGFGMAQLFDQRIGMQVPLAGSILNVFLLVMFFVSNTHHMLIKVLAETFVVLPPGKFVLSLDIGVVIVEFFLSTMVLVLRIAMPVMAAIFLTEVAMGIMIRSVPQMNMFVIGIPVKIFIGLAMLFLTVPLFFNVSEVLFDSMLSGIRELAGRATVS